MTFASIVSLASVRVSPGHASSSPAPGAVVPMRNTPRLQETGAALASHPRRCGDRAGLHDCRHRPGPVVPAPAGNGLSRTPLGPVVDLRRAHRGSGRLSAFARRNAQAGGPRPPAPAPGPPAQPRRPRQPDRQRRHLRPRVPGPVPGLRLVAGPGRRAGCLDPTSWHRSTRTSSLSEPAGPASPAIVHPASRGRTVRFASESAASGRPMAARGAETTPRRRAPRIDVPLPPAATLALGSRPSDPRPPCFRYRRTVTQARRTRAGSANRRLGDPTLRGCCCRPYRCARPDPAAGTGRPGAPRRPSPPTCPATGD